MNVRDTLARLIVDRKAGDALDALTPPVEALVTALEDLLEEHAGIKVGDEMVMDPDFVEMLQAARTALAPFREGS